MATIVTRAGKGSPLTNTEVDDNFTNLNTDKLEKSGGTMTGDLTFGDNDKAIFGAGSDLQIYHTGSNSIIDDLGTGNLLIRSDGTAISLQVNSKNSVRAVADEDVELYYNGSEKLATTSTGIDVTGNVVSDGASLDGAVVINESGADVDFRIESDTNANAFFLDGATGNVGINTSSPAERLDLSSSFPQNLKLGLRGYLGQASSTSGTLLGHSVKAETVSPTANELVVTETNSGGGAPAAIYMESGKIEFHTAASGTAGATFDSERMRIDSSGRVGIGTSSPTNTLQVAGNIYATTTVRANGGNSASSPNFAVDGGTGMFKPTSNIVGFSTVSTERMRIDSSGNLLVGTTSVIPDIDNVDGVSIATGTYDGRIGISRDGLGLAVNRKTSDGDIVAFKKNGTTVGSIGVASGALYTGNSTTFTKQTGGYFAPSTSSGGNNNGGVGLGYAGNAFSNLYLSGGVYLGGTGAANYLDDYEEGTWTATLEGSSSNPTTPVTTTAYYTKVGNIVSVQFSLSNFNSSGASGEIVWSGLPFTNRDSRALGNAVSHGYAKSPTSSTLMGFSSFISSNSTSITLLASRDSVSWESLSHNAGSGKYAVISITYRTD